LSQDNVKTIEYPFLSGNIYFEKENENYPANIDYWIDEGTFVTIAQWKESVLEIEPKEIKKHNINLEELFSLINDLEDAMKNEL
jgi:hypothetical protein